MLHHLQGSNPVVLSAEVQYIETLGFDQYGLKKKAEREQMKIKLQLVYLFFTFCFDFRESIFTQEQTKSVCCLRSLPPLPTPEAPYAGKAVCLFVFLRK